MISPRPLLASTLALSALLSASASTWDGKDSSPLWESPLNWTDNATPAESSPISFTPLGSNTPILLGQSHSVQSLDFTYTASDPSSHTLDLQGNTLHIEQFLDIGHTDFSRITIKNSASVTILNGTLSFAPNASITLAHSEDLRGQSTSSLTLGENSIFQAGTLQNLWIASVNPTNQSEGVGTLDLSSLTQPNQLLYLSESDPIPGTLRVQSLHVGSDPSDRFVNTASLSIGNALKDLIVEKEFFFGHQSASTWDIPSNASFTFGIPNSQRAEWKFNVAGNNRDAAGADFLWTPTGPSFSAYLSSIEMGIGSANERASGSWIATLDLTQTPVSLFDVAESVTLGGAYTDPQIGKGNGQATLRLPNIPARIGGDLILDKGGTNPNRFGRLELHNTQLTIEGNITLNPCGSILCSYAPRTPSPFASICAPLSQAIPLQNALEAGQITASNIPSGASFGIWISQSNTYIGLLPPPATILIIR